MTDPERVEEAARSFLDDHPDAEDNLRELVAVDSEGPWTFEDTDLDSGRFGELVSRECVDSVDGDYRFADRTAVRAALGEASVEPTAGESDDSVDLSVSLPSVDVRVAVALVGALLTVAGARMIAYRSVFQEGYVVSPANDPYFYRYWQERMFETGENATAVEMLANVPGDGRAMTHYPNWLLGDLLGGTPEAAEPVVAWLPIVSAVLTALCLYAIAVLVTDDQRIALATVGFLALTPVHAIYTGLGFLEHRPHQYFWLAVLVLALVWLATDVRRRLDDDGSTAARDHARNPRAWAVAAVLAIAVFGSVFSWAGSPITFVPVAGYLGFRVLADVRADVSPIHANAPTLAGIAAGTVLVLAMHLQFGWDETLAIATPVLVTLGGVGVVALAAVWDSLDRSPLELFVGETVVALGLSGAFWLLRPDDVGRLQDRAGQLFGREGATETSSLFALDNIIIEPMTQMGGGFYLALAGLAVATALLFRRYEPGWLLLVVGGWYYLVLAAIQVRFAAHLSLFFSLFAAVTLVYGLAWMDLARTLPLLSGESLDGPPLQVPDSTAIAGYLVGAVVGLLLLNLIFLPSFVAQANYDSEEFGATVAILDYHENHSHHSEFVLSRWGTYRMYNYFVSGESHNYGRALQYHEDFITSTDADEFYSRLSGTAGYVVLEDRDLPDGTTHTHLFEEFGAGENALGHYQLLYSTNETRAFVVVRGATLRASGPANGTVTARTNISRAGESFTYERTVRVDENGTATIDVAYPGTYDVGEQSVRVSKRNVTDGGTLDVDETD